MFGDLLALLEPEISGSRVVEEASAVQAIDRHFTFSSFQQSARHSAKRLREAGLDEVQVLEAPADGKSVFGDWMMPLAWEVEGATLDVLGRDGSAERVADRAQVPQCLAMWSAPTPAEGVEAEIVWVENAADEKGYPAEGVRGKIVFTSAHPHQAKRLVAARGGLGILSDFQPPAARLPEAVSWINSWSDDPGGWAFTSRDAPAWAFVISPSQGERLRERLKAGETLRGRAVVRSSLGSGTLPAVTGIIPGSGREEVLLLGHQFEVGAVDNASGVAAMGEAARALRALIAGGKLPAPQRSIRLLFVSECYTTLFWVEEGRRARRTIAGLCLDSPGGGAAELGLRPLDIRANPHSQMSYADALLLKLASEVMSGSPTRPWLSGPFAMTDNLVADRTIDIPCPWIGGHSRTWHTSADTPDILEPEVLGLVARMTAAYAYLIAAAEQRSVLDFAHLAAARGKSALAETGLAELELLGNADLDDCLHQMAYVTERHAEAVASVLKLLPPQQRSQVRGQVRALQRDVRSAGKAEGGCLARRAGRPGHTPAAQEPKGELAAIRPRRLVTGPLTLDRLAPEDREGRPSPRWSEALFAVLNWCDGKRSLAEACELAARELRGGRTLAADELAKRIDPGAQSMLDYFEFLSRHGYVSW
jgi:hypothetical protein